MKARQHSHGEGSYLEALSDLFVGFLFIFIIFLMLFALLLADTQKKTEAIQARLLDAGSLRAQMLEQVQEALKRHGIIITIDARTGIARLPESLLFESGQAQLRPEGRSKLFVVARELRAIVPCYAQGLPVKRHCLPGAHPILDAMFVEGHTDNIPISNSYFADNYDLSAARSKQTFQALLDGSSDLRRLRNDSGQELLSLSAYGDERPLVPNTSELNRRANRRIDLRFVVGTPKIENVQDIETSGKINL